MSQLRNKFRIEASPGYTRLSIALHFGAACMLMLSHMPMGLTIVLSIVLMLAALADARSANQIRHCIVIRQRGFRWRVMTSPDVEFGPARVVGGRVLPWISWLRLRDDRGRMQTLCIPADAMNESQYRQFRVLALQALAQ